MSSFRTVPCSFSSDLKRVLPCRKALSLPSHVLEEETQLTILTVLQKTYQLRFFSEPKLLRLSQFRRNSTSLTARDKELSPRLVFLDKEIPFFLLSSLSGTLPSTSLLGHPACLSHSYLCPPSFQVCQFLNLPNTEPLIITLRYTFTRVFFCSIQLHPPSVRVFFHSHSGSPYSTDDPHPFDSC